MKIYEPKKTEVSKQFKIIYNVDFLDENRYPSVVRMVKSRRLRWASRMAKVREARYSSTILLGNILKTCTSKTENDKEKY